MAFDFRMTTDKTATRDLAGGWVSDLEELRQRILTRLARVRGEWFLNTRAGIPYYNFEGNAAVLGQKDKRELELRLIEEALSTAGVVSVLKCEITVAGKGMTTADIQLLTTYGELAINSYQMGDWQ